MLTFSSVFQTRQQALDVYKRQLSGQKFYVESFESYPSGTPAKLILEIVETAQRIELDATVDCGIGRKMAIERHLGQRPGLILNVPIRPEIVAPLRDFFSADNRNAQSVSQLSNRDISSKPANTPVRPPIKNPRRIPFENLQSLSAQDALAEVDRFLSSAKTGSLYVLFNVPQTVERTELRTIYNTLVRVLHPDRYPSSFSAELCGKLSMAYQVLNDAYKILQNATERSVYMDISRQQGKSSGMSLESYRKWQNDYCTQNANNIRMAEELVAKAQEAQRNGDENGYTQTLKLALKYDPYCQAARAKLQKP